MAEKDKFDEFLDEVEEDIRQERFAKLWQTYGKHVTTGITVILVGLAGYTLWSNHKTKEHAKNSEFFITAQQLISEGKTSQAQSVLKEITGDKTYTPLAQFAQAAILADGIGPEGKTVDQAITLYDHLSADPKIELLWRHVAALQSIRLKFEKNADHGANLLPAFDALIAEGAPLRALALEQKAYMLHTMGKNTEAAELFVKVIQMKDAPEGIIMRAQIMSEKLAAGL